MGSHPSGLPLPTPSTPMAGQGLINRPPMWPSSMYSYCFAKHELKGVLNRDVRDQKNYTSPGPGPKEKLYRDQNRDRKKITGTTTGTGTNA